MSVDNFKEWVIFQKEKDKPNKNIREFKYRIIKKYDYKGDISSLYQKIVKYQTSTFGKSLHQLIEGHSREECYKLCGERSKQRYLKRQGRKVDENKEV